MPDFNYSKESTSFTTQNYRYRKSLVVSVLGILAFGLAITYIPNIIKGEWERVLVGVLLVSTALVLRYFASKNYVDVAQHILFNLFNMVIFIYAGLHGKEAGTHMHFVTSTLAATFVFNYGKKIYLWLYVSMPIFLWAFLEFYGYLSFPIDFLNAEDKIINGYMNQLTFVVMLMFFAFAIIRLQNNFQLNAQKFEAKILEQNSELLSANNLLQKSNRELDVLLYTVSHDLRSPLNSAQGIVSILEETKSEEEKTILLDYLKNTVDQVLDSTAEIVYLAKNRNSNLELVDVPFKKVVQRIFEINRSRVNGVSLIFEVSAPEGFKVHTDLTFFKSILQNLISNALKFVDVEKSNHIIRIAGEESESIYKITIWDNGLGIPEDESEAIFNMFQKLESGSDGFGLGLYLVKEYAKNLSATINVNSEFGKFTEFVLTIPKKDFSN